MIRQGRGDTQHRCLAAGMPTDTQHVVDNKCADIHRYMNNRRYTCKRIVLKRTHTLALILDYTHNMAICSTFHLLTNLQLSQS